MIIVLFILEAFWASAPGKQELNKNKGPSRFVERDVGENGVKL